MERTLPYAGLGSMPFSEAAELTLMYAKDTGVVAGPKGRLVRLSAQHEVTERVSRDGRNARCGACA